MDKAKPFCIAKREVWEAYKQVKANQGAAGVDGQTIEDFEKDLNNNLYGSGIGCPRGAIFRQPVRRVDIPKGDGRTRPLGISDGIRPDRPDGSQAVSGAHRGAGVSQGLVWISARAVGPPGAGSGEAAMLGL